jgi:geranylgeranyl diphosphate synthase type I
VLDLVGRSDLDDADIDRIRDAIDKTGARQQVEAEIEDELTTALAALAAAPVTGAGRAELRRLAHAVTERDR